MGRKESNQTNKNCQHKSILILTHKKIRNMNKYFRVYNDSTILNMVLEFPVTLVWSETHIFTYILIIYSCKN